MFNSSDINKQLKQAITDFKDTYKRTCKKSREDYLNSAGVGSQVRIPKENEGRRKIS